MPGDFGAWAVDPTTPGPDLPPVGRSLFDHLVAPHADADGTHRLPFPFWTFVDQVRTRLTQQEYAGGTRGTLIPLGRSLQRIAAAPDFFRYPRAVVGVTGEPLTSATDAGMLLKDRLYIGYVEKTDTLEVISYNETAGRFEFQIVKDYREGSRARVLYANRAVCTACHQNQAPIFSVAIWSETTANGRVATLLGARLRELNLPRQSNLDFPDDLNKAAVRANAILALQKAWQQGCWDADDRNASRRCRAAALIAMLQFGLTGERDFDAASPRFASDHVAVAQRVWRQKWPQGMSVPQSDLPDRNPFGTIDSVYRSGNDDDGSYDWVSAAHVAAALDPLNPRPAREVWRFAGAMDAHPFVAGWTRFLAVEDFRALNAHLLREGKRTSAPRTSLRGPCTVMPPGRDSPDLKLKCVRDGIKGVQLAVRFAGKTGRIEFGDLGAAGELREVELDQVTIERHARARVMRAHASESGFAPRLRDGRRLAGFTVRWRDDGSAQQKAVIDVTVVDDFAPVRVAVDRLLERRPELFDPVPLARARLLPPLFEALGMQKRTWCCVDDRALPAAQAEQAAADAGALARPELQPFFRYCSGCHLTPEAFPPNFLAGDATRVAANLRQYAPRMLVRLGAWHLAAEKRSKSPMPPPLSLQAMGVAAADYAQGADLAQMTAYLETLAAGRPDAAYEALPGCLAAR